MLDLVSVVLAVLYVLFFSLSLFDDKKPQVSRWLQNISLGWGNTLLIPFLLTIWNKFTHHSSSSLSCSVPWGLTGLENKAKMWWKAEMKRPVVTSRGWKEDSSWGEDKPSHWREKLGCLCLSLSVWRCCVTPIYCSIFIEGGKSGNLNKLASPRLGIHQNGMRFYILVLLNEGRRIV